MQNLLRSPPWALVVPGVAVLALAATWGRKPGDVVLALVAAFLAGAVLASVPACSLHETPTSAHDVAPTSVSDTGVSLLLKPPCARAGLIANVGFAAPASCVHGSARMRAVT